MRFMEIYRKHQEGINYLFFGVLTTVLSLASYYALTMTVLDANNPLQLQIANVLSWIVGVLFAYVTNRLYVFRSKSKEILQEFCKFLMSRVSTLLLDMAIMFIFVTLLHYDNQWMKLVSQVAVIISNYVLSKLLVFKKKN